MIAGLLSILFTIQPVPALAQDHAARVDKFLASLPPSTRSEGPDAEADAAAKTDIERLRAGNPGKDAEIRTIVEARTRCNEQSSNAFVAQSLRVVADALTDAELDKLAALYSGADYPRMLAAADGSPEMKALIAQYPLMRFYEVTQKVMAEQMPKAFKAISACDTKAEASLTAAGIKND